jgi:hypothetical protein
MSSLIEVEKLIKQAKKEGVSFGRGDPYNRLRYYTKIGWLPHMERKRNKSGDVVGHYPKWVLNRLILIDRLKKQGANNDYISSKINTRSKIHNFYSKVTAPEFRNRLISYATVLIVFLILLTELDIINLSKSKNKPVIDYNETLTPQLVDSGNSFVPAGKNRVFVKNNEITSGSKVYVTFNQNFSPATRFWVSKIEAQKGFYVDLDAPVFDNVEFSWWISQ